MVKHIVFFKLSKSLEPENRQLQLKKLEEIFAPLGRILPYIIEYRTGINFNVAAHSWDFLIDSIFRNKEDLQRYQDSEEHKEAIKRGLEIDKTKAVIDYEF
jgi:hypothetical protein